MILSTDGRTDRRTRWNQDTRLQLRWAGGIILATRVIWLVTWNTQKSLYNAYSVVTVGTPNCHATCDTTRYDRSVITTTPGFSQVSRSIMCRRVLHVYHTPPAGPSVVLDSKGRCKPCQITSYVLNVNAYESGTVSYSVILVHHDPKWSHLSKITQ